MLRAAVMIILVATAIGALMPGDSSLRPQAGESAQAEISIVDDAPAAAVSSTSAEGSITLERSGDGHFYADAKVNGAPVHFLVDTGATLVALATSDARRAGIPLSSGSFEVVGQGASGPVRGLATSLERVSLGHKEAEDMPAVVLEGSEQSLLGQEFLRRFDSVTIEDDRMVLR